MPSAQYNLAAHLLERQGPASADEAKAAEWMQKAAAGGNPQAEYDLGAFYQFGRGVPIDKAKAAEWIGQGRRWRLAGSRRSNMA